MKLIGVLSLLLLSSQLTGCSGLAAMPFAHSSGSGGFYMYETGLSDLHVAARDGDRQRVNQLLAQGADINIQTSHGRTPLFLAADEDQLDVVKDLLDAGALVNIPRSFAYRDVIIRGNQPNSPQILSLLIEHGLPIGSNDPETPFGRKCPEYNTMNVALDQRVYLRNFKLSHCIFCIGEYRALRTNLKIVKLLADHGLALPIESKDLKSRCGGYRIYTVNDSSFAKDSAFQELVQQKSK